MPTRVLLTIDTELKWERHAAGLSWEENFALSIEPAGVGISYQLARLAAHGLKACFFVDPMPALVYGIEPIRRILEPILKAGQEVQLHLHPSWANPSAPVFELVDMDENRQLELIRTARDLLVEAGAVEPCAFRSGSFAVNRATLRSLASLGIHYDSSHNGSYHPWPSALPLEPRQIAPTIQDGVVEIPVTQFEQHSGKVRHLQICAVSFGEMKATLNYAANHDHSVTTLVGHSFELATRDGARANPMLVSRFERLCGFLAEHPERLATTHFADLGDLALDMPAPLLRTKGLQNAARVAQQIWGNAVYERAF